MPAEPLQPNILALHGFTGVGADFAPFARLCSSGTWHCPNLPGHGPEPERDCGPVSTLRWIEDQGSSFKLQASTSNILLGYSMGARAALLHASEYPAAWDALILVSPNPGIENPQSRAKRRRVDNKLARRIENEDVEAFIEFWQSTPMIRSQKNIRAEWRDAMQTSRQLHTAEGLATSLREFGQGSCPNLWPKLHRLTLPVLLLTGAEDIKYTRIAQAMDERLPQASTQHIDGAGHMPHLEAPDESADRIHSFLKTLG